MGDRAFGSYADFVKVQNHQADAVFRKHQGRENNMRRGKRIGPCDKLVLWNKPKSRPKGLSKEEFAALPRDLVLREVHYYIAIPGFRTKQVRLITTPRKNSDKVDKPYTTQLTVGTHKSLRKGLSTLSGFIVTLLDAVEYPIGGYKNS